MDWFSRNEFPRLSLFDAFSRTLNGNENIHFAGNHHFSDRRLQFDDGKGLGLDDGLPVDNLPVNMAFTFVLEKITHSEKKVNVNLIRIYFPSECLCPVIFALKIHISFGKMFFFAYVET